MFGSDKTSGDQQWEKLGVSLAEVAEVVKSGIRINPFIFEQDWHNLQRALKKEGFEFMLTAAGMLGVLVDLANRKRLKMPPISLLLIAVGREADRRIRQVKRLSARQPIPESELLAEADLIIQAARAGKKPGD